MIHYLPHILIYSFLLVHSSFIYCSSKFPQPHLFMFHLFFFPALSSSHVPVIYFKSMALPCKFLPLKPSSPSILSPFPPSTLLHSAPSTNPAQSSSTLIYPKLSPTSQAGSDPRNYCLPKLVHFILVSVALLSL